MVTTSFTWYFLITAILMVLLNFIFSLELLRKFYHKKNMGTALLAITYLCIGLAEIINATGMWFGIFGSPEKNYGGLFQLNFITTYSLAFVFFYYFAQRYFLNDNDLIKGLTTILLSILVGVFSTRMYTELRSGEINPLYYKVTFLEGINLNLHVPTLRTILILNIPIYLLVLLRIVLKLIAVQSEVKDKTPKTGFRFILISIISLGLSVIIYCFFSISDLGKYPGIVTILQTIRMYFVICTYIFGYFGWLLPPWFKRIIRKKLWIAEKLENGNISEYSYSSSEIDATTEEINIQIETE
ncbi:MAG: hypothetical protein U9O98_10630 [Asgard group archaeon]|nr:hypothetical protein [Asgard group archaeon]